MTEGTPERRKSIGYYIAYGLLSVKDHFRPKSQLDITMDALTREYEVKMQQATTENELLAIRAWYRTQSIGLHVQDVMSKPSSEQEAILGRFMTEAEKYQQLFQTNGREEYRDRLEWYTRITSGINEQREKPQ